MKKIIFLSKIHAENHLDSVEPSKEIMQAYIRRSEESLSSAKALLKIGNLKDSVALSYYAMYHSVLAALFSIGIKSENHTASIILLKEVFEIDNTKILRAKTERIDKQYYVDFTVKQDEALNAVQTAEKFIAKMQDSIATLNEEKIKQYHKKATELFQ